MRNAEGMWCRTVLIGAFSMMMGQVAEASVSTYDYAVNASSGATLTVRGVDAASFAATVSDTGLASVSVSLTNDVASVVVTGHADAAGVVTLALSDAEDATAVEIPVGLTTFVFDGARVTVYEGDSSNYEVIGWATDDSEVSQKQLAADHAISNEDGSVTYSAPDGYALNVGLKKKGGAYVFTGSSDDASIKVKKEATGASTLYLANLMLASASTSPIQVSKGVEGAAVTTTIHALAGTSNALSDAALNNDDIYGTDAGGDNAIAESAVIKAKTNSDLVLAGTGALTLTCATKNAVKAGVSSTLTVRDVTLEVTSVKHGLSCDNILTVESGILNLVTMEDAIRSDPDAVTNAVTSGVVNIRGGTITINAGDDAVHALDTLTIGAEGNDNAKLALTVTSSTEGLEGRVVEIYSGTIRVTASDDGINAADGTSSESTSTPGGRFGWGGQASGSANVSLTIHGGNVYVDADGDGLDSNGTLNLLGGTIVVWGAEAGRADQPLDCDGTLTISGATVFAAGSSSMRMPTPVTTQRSVTSTATYAKGATIPVQSGGTLVYLTTAIKRCNYFFYTAPTMTAVASDETTATTLVRNMVVSESISVANMTTTRGTIKKLSGSLPSGVKLTYDATTQSAVLSGTPTRTGSYTYTFYVTGQSPVEPITLSFSVVVPSELDPDDENYNALLGVAASRDVPLVADRNGTNVVAGLLTVSQTKASRLSAKLVGGSRTYSFSGAWSDFTDGTVSTTLTTRNGPTLALSADRDGVLSATVTNAGFELGDTLVTMDGGVEMIETGSYANYAGIYTVGLDCIASDGVTDESTSAGCPTVLLKMNTAAFLRSGKASYAVTYADGTRASGTATFDPDSVVDADGVAYGRLTLFKRGTRNTTSGLVLLVRDQTATGGAGDVVVSDTSVLSYQNRTNGFFGYSVTAASRFEATGWGAETQTWTPSVVALADFPVSDYGSVASFVAGPFAVAGTRAVYAGEAITGMRPTLTLARSTGKVSGRAYIVFENGRKLSVTLTGLAFQESVSGLKALGFARYTDRENGKSVRRNLPFVVE